MATYLIYGNSGNEFSLAAYADGKSNSFLVPLSSFGTNLVPNTVFTVQNNPLDRLTCVVSPSGQFLIGTLSAKAWIPSQAYSLGYFALDSNGNLQICTTAGTSGTTNPTWSTTVGGSTTDGTAVWSMFQVYPLGTSLGLSLTISLQNLGA